MTYWCDDRALYREQRRLDAAQTDALKKMTKERHKVGDRVVIKRHHHGWLDGAVYGEVTEVRPRDTGSCGYLVKGDDRIPYEIDHTRDLIR